MARPRSDISERIVHAARARFLEDGVDGASLRRIAKDAHTNVGMIYYYFPTKDDLFLAVVEEVYPRILDDLSRALGDDVPVAARIERMYARLAALSDDELTVIRTIVREALVSSSRRERLLERFARGHLPIVLRAMADGIAAGDLTDRHGPAVLGIAAVALGIGPQLARRMLPEKSPLDALVPRGEALARALADVFLHGAAKA